MADDAALKTLQKIEAHLSTLSSYGSEQVTKLHDIDAKLFEIEARLERLEFEIVAPDDED